VAAARAAFDEGPWPHAERAERLRAMGRHLRERATEIAQAWTGRVGVVISFTKGAGDRCADVFDISRSSAREDTLAMRRARREDLPCCPGPEEC
jgi:acyl-CoA reductase-like NAD-dependent aldehyde dehydrogenase